MAFQCAWILRHSVQGLLTHSVLLLLADLSFSFDFLLLHFFSNFLPPYYA